MKKIALVFGTRPEIIKIAPLYLELKKSKRFKLYLINTGQHKEMVDTMLKWFGIEEDFNLRLMTKNQNLESITSKIILDISNVFKKIKPDMVIVEGDTVSVMSASISAFYQKIPVVHLEAGLRTDEIYNPFPEEMARRVVSRLASIHLAPTKNAVQNLKNENLEKNVFCVGNTVIDALIFTKNQIEKTYSKNPPITIPGLDLKKDKIILVTMHRRENFGSAHKNIAKTLVKIVNSFPDVSVVLPLHLNPNVRNVIEPILRKNKKIFLIEPPGYVPFVYLMQKSYLILTDSGGVQEEAPSLGKPVLVLRTNTERPEGIIAGSAKLVGTDPDVIFKETSKLLTNRSIYLKMSKVKNPYGDGKASKKIVKILEKSISR